MVRVLVRLQVGVAATKHHLLDVVQTVARELGRAAAVLGEPAHELRAEDVEAAQLVHRRERERLAVRAEVDEAVAAGHDRLPLCDPVGRLEVVAARVLRGLAHEGALERRGPFLGVVLAEVA